jgi:hypothetical protein
MSIEQAIADFAAKSGNGAFPNIPRDKVAAGLLQRIASPQSVDQGQASLCGPASLAFSILSNLPAMWVDYVTSIYDRGATKLGKLLVKPSDGCRNARLGTKIAPVDWVGLASLRDSENAMFSYDNPDAEFSGITMPGGLEEWFEKTGFKSVSNETNVWFTKGVGNLKEAASKLDHGHSVCLFIWAEVINGHSPGLISIPNHWVVMTRRPQFSSNSVSFEIFTWGGRRTINMQLKKFLDAYYGYVAGKW